MQAKWDLDRWGVFASAACAVHCLLTGVALTLLPIVGLQFLASSEAEIAFIVVALTLGSWAVVHGIRKHHDWRPSLLYIAGIAFLLGSHFVFGHQHLTDHDGPHEAKNQPLATVTAVLAGLSFVTFHVVNARKQRACRCETCVH